MLMSNITSRLECVDTCVHDPIGSDLIKIEHLAY
jgi:hypothetical protein